ncbi:MAG: lamin tail domain-containing protein [Phycisphaerales bacterium]
MKNAMVLSAMTAVGLLCAAGQAQVVISQVYGGGGNSGATLRNDFIELKNIGTTPVNIAGWSVQYSSATGVFQPTNASLRTVLTGMTLQPGQYYLIQEAAGTGGSANLPTPDMVGAINMSATGAKIVLINSSTAITDPTDPSVVDFVGYGTANAWEGAGAVPPCPTRPPRSVTRTAAPTPTTTPPTSPSPALRRTTAPTLSPAARASRM